jgi:hypothetical protein
MLLESRKDSFSIMAGSVRRRFWLYGFQMESTGLAPRAIPTMSAKRFRPEPLWVIQDCRLAPALPRSCSDSAFRPIEATRRAELKRSE